jgi:tubulin-specific chaperone A
MHFAEYCFHFQAELEESNQKDGPEIDEAKSTITEVDQLFQTTEA